MGAENPNTFVPVNLSNGVALTFGNPLTPLANGDVFLAKAEFTTLVNVANSEFKIEIEKVKLVENINNFDEITSGNEIVFNRSSTTNTLNPFQIVWPIDGDINYDGHVNVADFLLLVDNFGKTGTVPTSRMAIENALAIGGSQVPPSNGGTPPTNTATSTFDLDIDNSYSYPSGITYANNHFYVLGGSEGKVYVYTSAGQRDETKEFDLHGSNSWPTAITYVNNHFYVADSNRDQFFVYTSNGQRIAPSGFHPDRFNSNSYGITYMNNHFYVVDVHAGVFVYTSDGQRNKTR